MLLRKQAANRSDLMGAEVGCQPCFFRARILMFLGLRGF